MTQQRILFAEDKPSKPNPGTQPGRLLDLIILTLALDAYALAGTNDAVSSKGLTMWRQHKGDLDAATLLHLKPMVETQDALSVLRSKLHLVEMITPERKARFYEAFMEQIRKHPSLMRDLFTGRAYSNAQKVAAAVSEGDVEMRLQKLSLIPTSSGLSAPMRWIDKAAEDIGVAPSAVDSAASHAEATQGVVEEMRRVRTGLEAIDPASPDAEALQDRKDALDAELQDAIDESDNPAATLAAVATSLAQKPKSKVVEDFGLTEEQAAVVASKGKVVVAAAAGSGKTQTAVAWIASLVKEQGYAPEQILACSFTRAAAAELESRVESQAGVRRAEIGTTHSIARMVIGFAHPELAAQIKPSATKLADKCFKIAMKQVELSAGGYSAQLEKNKELLSKIEAIPGWRSNDFLSSLHRQLEQGRTLSDKQVAALDKFKSYGGGYGGGYRRRYADEDITPIEPVIKKAADEDGQSKYWNVPAGQWFNLGEKLVDDAGKAVGSKRASLAVENFKNGGISPEEAWQTYGSTTGFMRLMAALYGAYEWTKKNDPVYGPSMDFTDQLVKALDILRTEPKVLESMQRRFKVVIVDEAQDLNQIQFDFFSILGEKADVLAFVGDDKQSIYAFRGAKPGNYVDLTKKPGFQTKGITMNFRSGKAIVDAANKLIAHNGDRQIPMVCEADVARKGMGQIVAKTAATHEAGAEEVGQEIKDSVDSGDSPKDFGILVRNNAEADAYTLSLISRGVPYRMLKKSEGGYFGRPLVKALVAWMTLVVSKSDAEINDAVIQAHSTPGFNLDKMFASGLSANARGMNYLDYILAGRTIYFDKQAWRNKNVAQYADAIRGLVASGSTTSSEDLIRAILAIKGARGTFEDSLIALVDEDDIIEDEGSIEPSAEAIRDAAMAPLRPLMQMAQNFKDPATMMHFILKMKAANEKAQKKEPTDKDDWKEPAVLVGTVHGWKGLQAKHVFVCMAGGVFPNFRTEEQAEEDPTAFDEERRLAYVAITRGEQTVTIMSPSSSYLGKPAKGISRFIGEACIKIIGEEPPKEVPAEPGEVPPEAKTASFAHSLASNLSNSYSYNR